MVEGLQQPSWSVHFGGIERTHGNLGDNTKGDALHVVEQLSLRGRDVGVMRSQNRRIVISVRTSVPAYPYKPQAKCHTHSHSGNRPNYSIHMSASALPPLDTRTRAHLSLHLAHRAPGLRRLQLREFRHALLEVAREILEHRRARGGRRARPYPRLEHLVRVVHGALHVFL